MDGDGDMDVLSASAYGDTIAWYDLCDRPYPDNYDLKTCSICSGITYATESSYDGCKFWSLNFTLGIGGQVGVLVFLMVIASVIFFIDRPSKKLRQFAMVVFISSFDTHSDLLFVMSAVFYNWVLFCLSWAFIMLPFLQYAWFVGQKTSLLIKNGESAMDVFRMTFRFQIFSLIDGYPHIWKKRVFCFKDIGGHCGPMVIYLLTFLMCGMLQLVWLIGFVLFHLPFYIVVFVPCYWLHSCKLSQNYKTSKRCFKLILTRRGYDRYVEQIPLDEELNVEGINSAVIGELLLESIPQACVVLYNGYLMQTLTVIDIVTVVGSAVIIINGLFRFGYWRLWMGVKLRYIPLSGRPDEEHLNHSSFKTRIGSYFVSPTISQVVPVEEVVVVEAELVNEMKETGKIKRDVDVESHAQSDTPVETSSEKKPQENANSDIILATAPKSDLTLQQSIDLIRFELDIKETGIAVVLRQALLAFDDTELTERCENASNSLSKTRLIAAECGGGCV
jgi:hypothetical protein